MLPGECKMASQPLRATDAFRQATRLQESFLATAEKRALIYLARHTPAWINSDHLTTLGFAAQLITGLTYVLAATNRLWLIAGIGCLALNWLGDSMDGILGMAAMLVFFTGRNVARLYREEPLR